VKKPQNYVNEKDSAKIHICLKTVPMGTSICAIKTHEIKT